MRSRILGLFVVFFAGVAFSYEGSCRKIEFARVDNRAQLEKLRDVCEIEKSLAVFIEDANEATFPNLKRVGIINVDSKSLEAVAFPKLESARDIYLTGDRLVVAEFPLLSIISSRLVIQEQNLQFLNLPQLERVGRLVLSGCANLEFVFAEKLFDIASIRIENNPELNLVSEANLKKVTRKMGNREYELMRQSQEEMKLFRLRLIQGNLNSTPIRPTGHHTYFDYYGFIKSYYEWYPYEYSRYWDVIGPWGYTFFYRF
ncbi:MAG: hypothetical protein EBR01_04770 [Proteobacteria bacterium]|nr:hypothetical protein [Pseudomonadota bacterium]